MNTILFSIYTKRHGHQICSFEPFDKRGKSCYDQAVEYATLTYNYLDDVPEVYQLTQIPYDPSKVLRTPAEWEAMHDIEIVDNDGWRGRNGKSMTEPITLAEFKTRANESTVCPKGLKVLKA